MNSMGGDNFWLISDENKNVYAIDSCGQAGNNANIEFYKNCGFSSIPSRGPLSALTVPGAVAGWKLAYDFSVKHLGGKIPISRLLYDAEQTAKDGIAVTNGPGLAGALLTGVSFAKGLAIGLGIDIVSINHLEAHIIANLLDRDDINYPFLCLLVSVCCFVFWFC